MRRHATVVAQDGGMAVLRFKHDTSSCRSVLGTAGHDAKPPYSALIHAVISESEWAAPRNKLLWRPSLRRHATFVAKHVGMAVPRVSRDTRSCRSVGSTIRHDLMLTGDSLSHAGNADTE